MRSSWYERGPGGGVPAGSFQGVLPVWQQRVRSASACVCDTEGSTSVLCGLGWLGSGIRQTTGDLLMSPV